MVTDQEILEALQSLFKDSLSNPDSTTPTASTAFTYDVVQQLELKLGVDLTHKVNFIRSQIHLLSQPQHLPPLYQLVIVSPYLVPCPSNVSSVPHTVPAQPPTAVKAAPVAATVTAPNAGVRVKVKRKGGPGGLNKIHGVSTELQAIVGQPRMSRKEIVKEVWAYIRKNNLQDPNNKRKIICNDELRSVFDTDCVDMFEMNKYLVKHIISLEPTKQSAPKKQKTDVESGRSINPPGPVTISDALASFFGVTEKEMLQSEVYLRIWGYIRANKLENPSNPAVILCDAKLQELFGCQSIIASSIPEILGHDHMIRR